MNRDPFVGQFSSPKSVYPKYIQNQYIQDQIVLKQRFLHLKQWLESAGFLFDCARKLPHFYAVSLLKIMHVKGLRSALFFKLCKQISGIIHASTSLKTLLALIRSRTRHIHVDSVLRLWGSKSLPFLYNPTVGTLWTIYTNSFA